MQLNEMTALCYGIILNKQTVGHKNEFDMCFWYRIFCVCQKTK